MVRERNERNLARSIGRSTDSGINPLRAHKMTRWFQRSVSQANNKYTAFYEKATQQLELEELFRKFDIDGSGTLDLDELVALFQSAGLRVSSTRLKEMFLAPQDVRIVNGELDVTGFQQLMLSPGLEKAFRDLLKEIRRRFKYNDFSMVDPEIGFLPSDLRLMLGYLYKRSVRQNLTDQIVSDKLESTQELSKQELTTQLDDDLQNFNSLFNMFDDGNFDKELRQKYHVNAFERNFRKDQSPHRREQIARMRSITSFFLNRIKSLATKHQNIRDVVDAQLLTQKIPQVSEQRQMKMATEMDSIQVSIANLHKIKEERERLDAEKAKKEHEFNQIMRSLTLTKKKSQRSLEKISINKSSFSNETAEFLKLGNKEEQSLYEMLSLLAENHQLLEDAREFAQTNERTRASREPLAIQTPDDDEEEVQKIIEGIPSPKRVTKGKAVFIVPDPAQKETSEERRKRRNAAIAKIVAQHSSYIDSDSGSEQNQSMFKSNQDRGKPSADRKASTLLQQSQENQVSPLGKIFVGDSKVSILGRAVVNKQKAYAHPMQEQLAMDSRELMAELLLRNSNGQLSEFQKQQLQQIRNQSKRSKVIVYGDCVSEFERMVENRGQLFNSVRGFKRVNLGCGQTEETQESILVEKRSNSVGDGNPREIVIFDDVHRGFKPVNHSDSLFSLKNGPPEHSQKAGNGGFQDSPATENQDIKPVAAETCGLPEISSQQNQNASYERANRTREHQKHLQLMSQKAGLFVSPSDARA